MGGKSRKSKQVSRRLVARILREGGRPPGAAEETPSLLTALPNVGTITPRKKPATIEEEDFFNEPNQPSAGKGVKRTRRR